MLLVAGIIAATVSGCQTAPMTAKSTLTPMKGVQPLTSVKRTTVVTPETTNITMVETIVSPEQGQFELKKAELSGRKKGGVAKAQPHIVWGGGYGYYGGGSWGWSNNSQASFGSPVIGYRPSY